jgi:hypothetical protein
VDTVQICTVTVYLVDDRDKVPVVHQPMIKVAGKEEVAMLVAVRRKESSQSIDIERGIVDAKYFVPFFLSYINEREGMVLGDFTGRWDRKICSYALSQEDGWDG